MYFDTLSMKVLDVLFEKLFYEKFHSVNFQCLDYYAINLKDSLCTVRSTWDIYVKLWNREAAVQSARDALKKQLCSLQDRVWGEL